MKKITILFILIQLCLGGKNQGQEKAHHRIQKDKKICQFVLEIVSKTR